MTLRLLQCLGMAYIAVAGCTYRMSCVYGADDEVAVITGTVKGWRYTAGDGADVGETWPLAGAVVRAAIPAIALRVVRTKTEHRQFDTTTDGAGHYRLVLPVSRPHTNVTIDVFAPGFRSLAGSFMDGGDYSRVTLAPASEIVSDFHLEEALYVAGRIVDNAGKGLAGASISTIVEDSDGYGYIADTLSGADGSFEIFDFPLEGPDRGRGGISIEHPSYRTETIEDVYALTEVERKSLRIVMESGRAVKGRVVRPGRAPVAGIMVEASFADPTFRKAVVTDRNGEFAIMGLPDAKCTLLAFSAGQRAKAVQHLELNRDYDDLTLQLAPLPACRSESSVRVLGMELVNLNRELSDAYELSSETGVLVLDPGTNCKRLGLGDLTPGDCFFIVGDSRTASVREFLVALLQHAGRADDGSGECRVVYEFRRVSSIGTQTTFMDLTADDLKELRAVRDCLRPPVSCDTERGVAARSCRGSVGSRGRRGRTPLRRLARAVANTLIAD